ncbi:MAG: hypothetical protein ACOVP4_09955 [Bacteriovoracaceae bacterium]|jgi:hypothetical protein
MKMLVSIFISLVSFYANAQPQGGSGPGNSAMNEKIYVNQLKLVNFFNKKLNQSFNASEFLGEWLSPPRADQIYPGGCNASQLAKDPHIEKRVQLDLRVDVERYTYDGGPNMDITSKRVAAANVIMDRTNKYGLDIFSGSLARWSKKFSGSTEFCVVVKPAEVSQLTSLPFARPIRDFLLCKSPYYDAAYDQRKECILEESDPEDEFSEPEIDTQSDKCIKIALKNPCTHYNIYVRNY